MMCLFKAKKYLVNKQVNYLYLKKIIEIQILFHFENKTRLFN